LSRKDDVLTCLLVHTSRNTIQAGWIGSNRVAVMDIAIEITIPAVRAQRIRTDPPPCPRIIVTGPVVLQAGLAVRLPSGPLVAVAVGRCGFLRDVPERVERQRVVQRPAVVHQPPDRPQVVCQVPVLCGPYGMLARAAAEMTAGIRPSGDQE